jgi:hypothetical protein
MKYKQNKRKNNISMKGEIKKHIPSVQNRKPLLNIVILN